MKQVFFTLFALLLSSVAFSQSRFSNNEISINGFRNPSIGVEYRHKQISVHGLRELPGSPLGSSTRACSVRPSSVRTMTLPIQRCG